MRAPQIKDGPVLNDSIVPPKFVKTAEPWKQKTPWDLGNGKSLIVVIPGFLAKTGKTTYFITTYMYDQEKKIYFCFLPFHENGKRVKFDTLLLMRNSGAALGCLMEDAKKEVVHKGGPLYGFPRSLFTKFSREDMGHRD